MKNIIIFIVIFIAANSALADDNSDLLDQLVEVFNSCKQVDVQKKTYFYSRKFLAYRLGSILDKNSDDLANAVVVSKNVIGICSQADQVNRFVLEGSNTEPVLKIFYKKRNESDEKICRLALLTRMGCGLLQRLKNVV